MNSISTMKARFANVWAKARTGARGRLSLSLSLVAATIILAFSPAQAAAETRSLKLYYVHTGEKAEIAFKKNGRYLPDGLKRLNVFLRDWRRNEPTKMDPRLFDLIWQVYQSAGSREYINVVSAYRSPATNAMLRSNTRGVAKKSQHMLGRAMDYFIPGVSLAKLRGIGMRYQIGGVGYYPRSGSPFVHMDVGNVRSWPRMSRRELLALFPDGKTAHVPADGKPLPGYEEALAMIQKRKAGSGEIMMASNAPTRRSKTLFGALFGGGADEEEDNGDSAAPATARPARVTPAPAKQAPALAPQEPVRQQRETMIAALPSREAPIPMQAPRPEAALPGVAASAANPQTLDAQAQGGGEVVAPPAPVVALNVPIPARKPEMAPQDAVALAAADPDAAQVADASPLLNGFVPVPTARPQMGTDDAQLVAAVVPSQRPERSAEQPAAAGQDAIAALVNNHQDDDAAVADASSSEPNPGEAGALPLPREAPRADTQRASTQLAMLTKRDEIGELIAPPADDYDTEPVAAVQPKPAPVHTVSLAPVAAAKPAVRAQQTAAVAKPVVKSADKLDNPGVRTTAKGARRIAKATAKPHVVVQPAAVHNAEMAMSTESMVQKAPATSPVLRNDAMRTAPAMVYTAGFQRGDLPGEHANKFSGNAVTFLTVAKFSETN